MGLHVGAMAVRRSVFIQAPPRRVWEEFASAERIRGWLDRGHRLHAIEPREGGRVEMSVELGGVQRRYGGPVLVYDAPREMSFEIRWAEPFESDFDTRAPTYWTFRLTALHGGTQVEIFHHGFELAGEGAADLLEGYEQGWDVKHLTALRDVVER